MITPLGKIARVDQPAPGLLCLSILSGGLREVVLMSVLPTASGLGLSGKRPRGDQASTSTTQLRHHLVGASVQAIEHGGRFMRIRVDQHGATLFLVGSARRPLGAWWLLDDEGKLLLRSADAPPLTLSSEHAFSALRESELREAGDSLLEEHEAAQNRALIRILERHRKRLLRKRQAIRNDLSRVERLESLRETANLILAHASRIPDKAKSFDAVSWDDPERLIRIELDPRRAATEQAQAMFQKAKRLERGQAQAQERLALVNTSIEQVDRLIARGEQIGPTELSKAVSELGLGKARAQPTRAKRAKSIERIPYREFVSQDGKRLLVGRSAADNDRLTLRVAKPQHLWLHARGLTGAHVIVVLGKGEVCPSETLADAATLAAHFSDARGDAVVDVLYTPRRFVRKRKGLPVGAVTLEREKVIAVRMEPSRLQRLLRSERKSSAN